LQDEQGPQVSDEQSCLLPIQILAREANDVALVKVLSARSRQIYQGWPYRMLTARILQPVKNGRAYRATDILDFIAEPYALRTEDGKDQFPLVVDKEYFFLYRQPQPGEIWSIAELRPCHVLPNTPEAAAAIKQGIALDPSAGEPYDYLNEPYSEQ
jgi:hypothetical protein